MLSQIGTELGNQTNEQHRKHKAYTDGMVVTCYPLGILNFPHILFLYMYFVLLDKHKLSMKEEEGELNSILCLTPKTPLYL